MTAAIDVESRTLRIEREFKAPMERVFEAFVNPEHAKQWWGPEGLSASVVEMDVREGGCWLVEMRGSEGNLYIMNGVYKTIKPHSRLVYTWGWVNDGERGPETTVEILLTKTDSGTRLRLIQSIFDTTQSRDDHNGGWTSSLNCLEVFLAD